MQIGIAVLAAVAFFGIPASAQSQQDRSAAAAEKRYQEAVLADESERDPERALRLLCEMVDASDSLGATPELRTRAWLRIARIEKHLGRKNDAKIALTNAAAGTGPAAQEAKDQLAGKEDETQERLRARVMAALDVVNKSRGNVNSLSLAGSPGYSDLIWIGAPAVPLLLHEIELQPDNLEFISLMTKTLLEIGSDGVGEWIGTIQRSRDVLLRRAVVKGFGPAGDVDLTKHFSLSDRLRSRLLAFLDDPEPQVRKEALERLWGLVDLERMSRSVDDPAPIVRRTALLQVAAGEHAGHDAPGAAFPPSLLKAARRALDDPETAKEATRALQGSVVFRNDAGRRLLLDLLARNDPMGERFWSGWTEFDSTLERKVGPFEPALPADALLATVRALEPWPSPFLAWNLTRRQAVLAALVRHCVCTDPVNSADRDPWDASARPILFGAMEIGCRGPLDEWARKFSRPEEWTRLLEIACKSGWCGELFHPLWERREAIRAEDKPRLLELLSDFLAKLDAASVVVQTSREHGRESSTDQARTAQWAIVSLNTAPATGVVVESLRRFPRDYGDVTESLLKRDEPAIVAVASGLLAVGPKSAENEGAGKLRDRLVRRLVELGEKGVLEHLPAAYSLGLVSEVGEHNGRRWRGCMWLARRPEDATEPRTTVVATAYSPEEVACCCVACIDANKSDGWSDVVSMLRGSRDNKPVDAAIIRALAATLGARILECPDHDARSRLLGNSYSEKFTGWEELMTRALEQDELAGDVLDALHDPVPTALLPAIRRRFEQKDTDLFWSAGFHLVKSGDRDSRDTVLAALRQPGSLQRRELLHGVTTLFPDQAFELACDAMKDPDSSTRETACRNLGGSFDQRAVPLLVEALRDPTDNVRNTAKKSLESLQFYFDQRSRWEKWMQSAGLDAPSAADALLKQSGAGQPKSTRLAAIRSLGTLGVPETLPLLIQMMGDSDAEVAAAAKSAVDVINERGERGERGERAAGADATRGDAAKKGTGAEKPRDH